MATVNTVARARTNDAAAELAAACLRCGKCQKHCGFLQKHGLPGDLAGAWAAGDWPAANAYECSLCELCRAVCPLGLDTAGVMLLARQQAVERGLGPLKAHRPLVAYENRGVSARYSLHALPAGCNTVLFPGCALAGTRPETTWRLYRHLAGRITNLGLVLDCCGKPSHDLGMRKVFDHRFGWLQQTLLAHGVRRVLTACPNCTKVWAENGGEMQMESVYAALLRHPPRGLAEGAGLYTLHDACATRDFPGLQGAVRGLAAHLGAALADSSHQGKTAMCCGEGAGLALAAPELAQMWRAARARETDGNRVLVHCAGCAARLGRDAAADHLLDLCFRPQATAAGKAAGARPPFTYLNRLRLKNRARRQIADATVYTRPA